MPRLPVLALAACLAPSAAMACSCIAVAPEEFRKQADVIIEGRVTDVKRAGDINGLVTARIEVVRTVKGHPPGIVTVQTGGNSALCGYGLRPGQRQEFLLAFRNGRYRTDSCLMRGARRPAPR